MSHHTHIISPKWFKHKQQEPTAAAVKTLQRKSCVPWIETHPEGSEVGHGVLHRFRENFHHRQHTDEGHKRFGSAASKLEHVYHEFKIRKESFFQQKNLSKPHKEQRSDEPPKIQRASSLKNCLESTTEEFHAEGCTERAAVCRKLTKSMSLFDYSDLDNVINKTRSRSISKEAEYLSARESEKNTSRSARQQNLLAPQSGGVSTSANGSRRTSFDFLSAPEDKPSPLRKDSLGSVGRSLFHHASFMMDSPQAEVSMGPIKGSSSFRDFGMAPASRTVEEILLLAPLTAMRHAGYSNQQKINCWEEPAASSFQVRGFNYMVDHRKVSSAPAGYTLLGMELLASTAQHKHISARPGSFVQRYQQAAGNDTPFLLVFNFVLPFGNFLCYFCPSNASQSPYIGDRKFDNLLQAFLEGSNDFRDKRLKVIPRCVEGPWVVQQAVGTHAAIMGTKIKQNYYLTDKYFEVEVDIITSKAAGTILNAVKGSASHVALELAFVIQGENCAELPERILACLRFHRLDVKGAVQIDVWEKRA